MEWYWWVLIIVGIAGIGCLKIKMAGKIMANMNKRREEKENRMED